MTEVPRLCMLGLRDGDDPIPFVLGLLNAAAARGLSAAVCTIGADRQLPKPRDLARLRQASGRAVHRIDADLMPAPSIQGVVNSAGSNADVVLIVSFDPATGEHTLSPPVVDVQHALSASMVLCADAGSGDSRASGRSLAIASRVQDARGFFGARHITGDPVVLVAESIEGQIAGERSKSVAEATGLSAYSLHGDAPFAPADDVLDALLEHARIAPPMSAPPLASTSQKRRGRRARVGVILDDCFDLYDEEGLVHFEVAGAELVPLVALGAGEASLGVLEELDGLIIGDGRIERHSTRLSAGTEFRERLRELIDGGLPTIASGGGFAYLTRGLRTISGAFHPLVGAIDAEAVALAQRPSFGHVEIQTTVDTLIGPPKSRLRGFVQRAWLVRGVPPQERGIYTTVSGPRDEGCGRQDLLATHFRPYWPSCPTAAVSFVDRCVRAAVLRDGSMAASLAPKGPSGADSGS